MYRAQGRLEKQRTLHKMLQTRVQTHLNVDSEMVGDGERNDGDDRGKMNE